MLSGRQARWKDVIANFDFDIEYVEGKTNVVADGLSRRPDHQHSSAAARICRRTHRSLATAAASAPPPLRINARHRRCSLTSSDAYRS